MIFSQITKMGALADLLSNIQGSKKEAFDLETGNKIEEAIGILERSVEDCSPERLHELIDKEYEGQASWRAVTKNIDELRELYPKLLYFIGRLYLKSIDKTLSLEGRKKAKRMLENALKFELKPDLEKEIIDVLSDIYAPFGLKTIPNHPFNETADIGAAFGLLRRYRSIGDEFIARIKKSRDQKEINNIFRDYAFKKYRRDDITDFLREFESGIEAARSLGHALVWDSEDRTSLSRYGELYIQLVAIKHYFGSIVDEETRHKIDEAVSYFKGLDKFLSIKDKDNKIEFKIDEDKKITIIRSPFSETSNDVCELVISYSEKIREDLWNYCFVDRRAREIIKVYSKKEEKLEKIKQCVDLDMLASESLNGSPIKVPRVLDDMTDKNDFGGVFFARYEDIVGISLFDFVLILNELEDRHGAASQLKYALLEKDIEQLIDLQKRGIKLPDHIKSKKQSFSYKIEKGFLRIEETTGIDNSWYDKRKLKKALGVFDESLNPSESSETQYFDRSPRNSVVGVLAALICINNENNLFDEKIVCLRYNALNLSELRELTYHALEKLFKSGDAKKCMPCFADNLHQIDFEKCDTLTLPDEDLGEIIESPIFRLDHQTKKQIYSEKGYSGCYNSMMQAYKNSRWLYHICRWLADPKRDEDEKTVLREHFFVHLNAAIAWTEEYFSGGIQKPELNLKSTNDELNGHGAAGKMCYLGLYLNGLKERIGNERLIIT